MASDFEKDKNEFINSWWNKIPPVWKNGILCVFVFLSSWSILKDYVGPLFENKPKFYVKFQGINRYWLSAFTLSDNYTLTQIDFALLLDVIGNSDESIRLDSYIAEIYIGGKWVKLVPIPFGAGDRFFWCANPVKSCHEQVLREGYFDISARDFKFSNHSDWVKGWVFFRIPQSIKDSLVNKKGHLVRLKVKDMLGNWNTFNVFIQKQEVNENSFVNHVMNAKTVGQDLSQLAVNSNDESIYRGPNPIYIEKFENSNSPQVSRIYWAKYSGPSIPTKIKPGDSIVISN